MSAARLRHGGFTLIEVLVALAIVTVGMAALLSALSSSADSATYLRDKTFAEWVALNRIEEVRLALKRPQKGKSDGTADLAGRKWKWEQEVVETEVKGILRVDVRVKPEEVKGDRNWYTELSGITGDALAVPSGVIDYYARTPPGGSGGPNQPGGPRPGGQPGGPGNTGGAKPGNTGGTNPGNTGGGAGGESPNPTD